MSWTGLILARLLAKARASGQLGLNGPCFTFIQ